MVSQNDTSQLSSDAKDYLAGFLGKERGEATNFSHIDDKNEDDEDHDDVAWSEEQDESDDDDCSVSVLPKPGEASLTDTVMPSLKTLKRHLSTLLLLWMTQTRCGMSGNLYFWKS